ncbi:MAG: formate dehydrogenase accessory sulfurtransferase FdhD [Robiginitomaculum sp.]|nr:formate dehydrogenase accessory sulfurtransferase FdhD [Robiginitomaculum sp.]
MSGFENDSQLTAKVLSNEAQSVDWVVPSEVPIGFVYGGHHHAVMMATPADLEDFAIGFSLAEGILHHASEMEKIQSKPGKHGIELHLQIPQNRMEKLQMHGQRRAHRGRAGCGICGVSTASDAMRPLPRLDIHTPAPTVKAIHAAIENMPSQQVMRARNHTVHGAAWADMDGNLAFVREDIGRHNALDKMIGVWARNPTTDGFALLSSRCTYELVQKCALAGIGTLVCLAAPTSTAIETARKANMRLCIYDRHTRQILLFNEPELG